MTDSTHSDDLALDLLPGLRDAVAREDRGWRRLRSWPTRRRGLVGLAVLFLVCFLILIATPRPDMDAVPWTRFVIGMVLTVTAAAWSMRTFLRPMQERPVSATAAAIGAVALLLLPVALALLPPAHTALHAHPESFTGGGGEFVPRAVACLVFGLLTGAPVAAFLLLADRRAPARGVRAAFAAGAGGAAGTLGLLLHCPLVGVGHRVAGHGLVALALALILWAGIRTADRFRRASRRENPVRP